MGKAQKRKVKEQKRQLQKQDRRRGRVAAALAASDNPATSKLARKPREQRQHGRSGQQQSASRSGIGRAAEITYTKEQKILVVGDGDFSFCKALAQSLLLPATLLTATSFDTREEVASKYGKQAEACIAACEDAQACVMHGVDATGLVRVAARGPFDRVLFNFPHTGAQRVHTNRAMMAAFFASCGSVLATGGEVHVTLKMAPPYSEWGITALALAEGLIQVAQVPFDPGKYPGYRHKTTLKDAAGLDVHSRGALAQLRTLVFRRKAAAGAAA